MPSIATRTAHVGGIGKVWEENEAEIVHFFAARFGPVLTAVLRYREPTAEAPHNSWALVAFESTSSLEALMAGQSTACVQADDDVEFVVLVEVFVDHDAEMSRTSTLPLTSSNCSAKLY